MTLRVVLSAATILGLSTLPGMAFVASNSLTVSSGGAQTFSVAYRASAGESDYWCAAGDFVISALRNKRTTKIYRISPPPRPAGQGVTFSLSAQGAASSTGLTVYGADGASISASLADSFCQPLNGKNRR